MKRPNVMAARIHEQADEKITVFELLALRPRWLVRSCLGLHVPAAIAIATTGDTLGFQHGRQISRDLSKSLSEGVTWPSSRCTAGGRSCCVGW